jgi:hypothetical protein
MKDSTTQTSSIRSGSYSSGNVETYRIEPWQ